MLLAGECTHARHHSPSRLPTHSDITHSRHVGRLNTRSGRAHKNHVVLPVEQEGHFNRKKRRADHKMVHFFLTRYYFTVVCMGLDFYCSFDITCEFTLTTIMRDQLRMTSFEISFICLVPGTALFIEVINKGSLCRGF